jgi:peptidoglycan/xylan/chitin deacetylase (PgdA/CDA1 family)
VTNNPNRSAVTLAGVLLIGLLVGSAEAAPRGTPPGSGGLPGISQEASPQATYPSTSNPVDDLGGPTTGATYVSVLMYHWIRVNPDPRDRAGFILSVTPTDFTTQMLYLSTQGFHVVSLQTAVEAIRTHRALPPHPVVLTFDDGYRDFYTTAAPVLRRLGFTATEFVVTGFTPRIRYLDWTMIQTLDAQGFSIGDHTVHHLALTAIPPAQAWWEMNEAKQELEAHLHHPVVDLAYPSGEFNRSVTEQAQQLGFECAVSTQPGPLHTQATLMEMSRQRVSGGISMAYFAVLVGGSAPTSAWLRWARSQVPVLLVPAPKIRATNL